MSISIALVDDHPLLLSGIARMFEQAGDFDVVACGATADEAVEIVAQHVPDILILDLSLPGNAFDAIASIASKTDGTKVVAFTASTGIEYAVRALEAGASGYMLKGSTADEVMRGIRAVWGGEVYITQGFASKVISALRNASLRNASLRKIAAQAIKLSIREDQIIRLLLWKRRWASPGRCRCCTARQRQNLPNWGMAATSPSVSTSGSSMPIVRRGSSSGAIVPRSSRSPMRL